MFASLALLAFAFWDWALDPSNFLACLLIRIVASAIMFGCAWRLTRDPDAPLEKLIVVMLTVSTTGIAGTQALIEGGFAYGTAELILFPVVSSIAAARARDVVRLNMLPALGVTAILLLTGPWGFMQVNVLVFLMTGIFSAYVIALALERAARMGFLLELRLEAEARRDPLTGVPNRRRFEEQAEQEVERTRRFGRPLSVFIIDLDHFKHINDSLGHALGDEVLRAVAGLCRRSMRQTDLFARLGGEEFVALLPETNLKDATLLADRLRAQVSETPVLLKPDPRTITVSIGVAEYDPSNPSWQAMLDAADQALYEAKRQGRNRVVRSDRLPVPLSMTM